MSDYRVIARRSDKRIRQRFWVTIVDAGNGRTLFRSETYRDKDYAVTLAHTITAALDGIFIDAT